MTTAVESRRSDAWAGVAEEVTTAADDVAGGGRDWLLPAIVAAAVVATYSSLVLIRFGMYDDYTNSGRSFRSLLDFSVSDGRPLGGIFLATSFRFIGSFADLGAVRAVAIVLLAVESVLVVLLLRTHIGGVGAAIVSFAGHVTVGVQMVAAWGATLYVTPLAAIISGWGAWMIWSSVRLRSRRAVAGGLAVIAGLATYQPSGMAALAVVVLMVVVDRRTTRELVTSLTRTLAALVSSVALYAIVWKLCQALVPRTGSRGELATDLPAKWSWLVDEVVPRVLHPFSLSPHSWLSGAALGVLIVAAPIKRSVSVSRNLLTVAFTVLGLLACYAPNLAVEESWASSRSLWLVMVLAASLAAIGLVRIVDTVLRAARSPMSYRAAGIVGVLVVGALGFRAADNVVNYVAEPNAAELRAVQAEARHAIALGAPAIALIPASWQDSIAPGVSYDEFGIPASAKVWAILPMVDPVIADTGYTGTVRVVPRAEATTTELGDAYVIDLSRVLASIHD